jgi:hypothetical protein
MSKKGADWEMPLEEAKVPIGLQCHLRRRSKRRRRRRRKRKRRRRRRKIKIKKTKKSFLKLV